jgi:cytochrome c oxidase assembly protein subunit 15
MKQNQQYISIWLSIVALMIVSIVMLGGYTRLSGSGLSIVEWTPISGIVPPISDSAWQVEFDKYKMFPEYKLVNYNLSLSEFKFLFMVEFLHRILGRVIGLSILLPLIYFYYKKIISKEQLPKYLLILAIVCFQGFMGWYMVKSGLSKDPHVSHYRLSMHLITAVFLYSLILWQIIPQNTRQDSFINRLLKILLTLVYVQTFFGGMVAGLKAGMVYNTFPLMGGRFIPDELIVSDFSNPVTVQFIHRMLAYSIFLLVTYISYLLYDKRKIFDAFLIWGACFLQILMGVITLVYVTPVSWALAHQLGAIVLISSIIWCIKGGNMLE